MTFCEDLQTVDYGDISVSAGSVILEEKAYNNNLYGYYLLIENNSDRRISLIGKNWNITDEHGNSYNDSTAGFKGEIPELEPGEYFEFSSTAPLSADNAVFYGSCKILAEGKVEAEDIKIPTFSLSANKKSISKTIN